MRVYNRLKVPLIINHYPRLEVLMVNNKENYKPNKKSKILYPERYMDFNLNENDILYFANSNLFYTYQLRPEFMKNYEDNSVFHLWSNKKEKKENSSNDVYNIIMDKNIPNHAYWYLFGDMAYKIYILVLIFIFLSVILVIIFLLHNMYLTNNLYKEIESQFKNVHY